MKKEAEELKLEEALKANPRQAGLWCSLGEPRLRLNKLPEARAAFENALRMDAGLAPAHFGLAGVCKAEARPEEAIAAQSLVSDHPAISAEEGRSVARRLPPHGARREAKG